MRFSFLLASTFAFGMGKPPLVSKLRCPLVDSTRLQQRPPSCLGHQPQGPQTNASPRARRSPTRRRRSLLAVTQRSLRRPARARPSRMRNPALNVGTTLLPRPTPTPPCKKYRRASTSSQRSVISGGSLFSLFLCFRRLVLPS